MSSAAVMIGAERDDVVIMILFSEITVNTNGAGCVICEFVMKELDDILGKNATEVCTKTCYTPR